MHHEKIQKTVEELLKKMGVAFESITPSSTEERTTFVVKTNESNLLIGARGANLAALNHLVKRIIGRRLEAENHEGHLNFHIDVNDYHDKLVQEIKNKAAILAGRARSFKTSVEMEPMPSYERMVVHSFFQGATDIKTESVGEGARRRVVIKYTEDQIQKDII